MTGPQQSWPTPAPRTTDAEPSRPSPRPRHGRDDEPDDGPGAVPVQREPAEETSRRGTVADAAAARGFAGRDGRGPGRSGDAGRAPAARDSRALTVLRWITYLLVCLCCLVFLAAVVYAGLTYLRLGELFVGVPPFPAGGPGAP